MIELKNVSKVYKGDTYETHALRDLNLKIDDGAFVAVMGRSGSGKTTLLNIVGCMDNASDGMVLIDDIDVSKASAHKLDIVRRDKISFIFQNYALMEQYTVYENIELPLKARNFKNKDKKLMINAIMSRLGIEGLAKKYPGQISGGEQQRTAIARAFVADTRYILADEPTGALDHMNAIELIKIIKELRVTGKTILMVTHDREIAGFADKIIVLEDGTLRV